MSWTQPASSWAPQLLSYNQQHQQQQLLQQQAAAQAAAHAAAQAAKPSLRILIAEDNKVNQKVVLKVSGRAGMQDTGIRAWQ